MMLCETSGNNPANHFAGAGKMGYLGFGSNREVDVCRISRFVCFFIAQNGDPLKAEIGLVSSKNSRPCCPMHHSENPVTTTTQLVTDISPCPN